MPRPAADYRASDHIDAATAADPYRRPAFSTANKLRRLVWNITWNLLFRFSPRPFFTWRAFLLKSFGAQLAANCRFYPKAIIWAPWNLRCDDMVGIANDAEIYNPVPMYFGSHALVSQGAYVCGATHDYDDPAFPLLAYTMRLGAYSWVCARASVAPGVNLGDGAVLGLASVATRDLAPWTIHAGSPAVFIKNRKQTHNT